MAKKPSVPSAKSSDQSAGKTGQVLVPQKSVDIVKDTLGIDLLGLSPERVVARATATISTSSSPYTSGEILEDYQKRGMSDVKDRVLNTIDEERRWRHARVEQNQAHSHAMEQEEAALERARMNEEHAQQRRSQKNAFFIAVAGVLGSLIGAYFKLPITFCVILALICVGGPSTATIIARLLDKARVN